MLPDLWIDNVGEGVPANVLATVCIDHSPGGAGNGLWPLSAEPFPKWGSLIASELDKMISQNGD